MVRYFDASATVELWQGIRVIGRLTIPARHITDALVRQLCQGFAKAA
jgi:hypothetical protein